MKPKILFVELEAWEIAWLQPHLENYDAMLSQDKLEQCSEVAATATILSNFIYSPVTAAELAKMPNLKLIATRSTGFDHIDVAAARQRGVSVANVPDYGNHTVAEHTFALLLALSRRLPESLERTRRAQFSPEGLRGWDLAGKTIGLIGVGGIGRHVAKIARGFDMHVLAYQRHPDEQLAEELEFNYVALDELYAQSDIVSLHAPENASTHHLVDAKALSKMKDGVVILNTSRGGLIDTRDLLKALESGKVRAASLDVLEEEGLIKEERQLLSRDYDKAHLQSALEGHLLLSHPNVIVTPHSAFNSQEALERILQTTLENIEAFSAGNPCNVVS